MKNRFTEEQIICVLNESGTGIKVKELCRKHGIAQGNFYTWKAKFSGMEVFDAKQIHGFE